MCRGARRRTLAPVIPPRTPSRLHRVLILGPVPAAREALRWALESEPDLAVVGEAAGVEEALAGAAAFAPDVVLLDVARTDADAVAVTRALKAAPNPPAAILLAINGDAHARRRFALAGGDRLVEKGAGWPALIEAIRGALARRAGGA